MTRLNSYIKITWVVALVITLLMSCDDNEDSNPVITNVRLTNPATAGMALEAAPLGASIVIQGSNLGKVRELYLNDYEVNLSPVYVTNTNIVATIPDEVPTVATNPDVTNTLRIVTENGFTVTFPFETLPPPAVIESVSNEMAKEGEEITLRGKYFFFVLKVTFPGDVEGTGITTAPDGSWLKVTVPAGVDPEGGHIFVTSESGTSSQSKRSQFGNATGIFMNFDNLNPFGWGIPNPDNITNETPSGIIQPIDNKFGLINTVLPKSYGWSNGKVIDITYWSNQAMFPFDESKGYGATTIINNMDLRAEVAVEKPGSMQGIELLVYYSLDGLEYTYSAPLTDFVLSTDGKWYTVSVTLSDLVTSAGKKLSTYGQMTGQEQEEIRLVINNTLSEDIDGVIAVDNIRIINSTR
jgi:hypothetical protein